MKKIEAQKLKKLMDDIYYRPFANVVHFSDEDIGLSTELAHYCTQKEYSYQLNTPDEAFAAEAKAAFGELPSAKAFKMPLSRPKFRIAGKEYEYFILTLEIDASERTLFLRKAHDIIRSHGKIVIFIPKGDRTLQDQWIADLEETLFVATSVLEGIFDHYDIILSTKMHGWGEAR